MSKRKKLAMAGAGIASIAAGSLLSYKLLFSETSYTVSKVFDGDTFETVQKQRVRIDNIQAPEVGLCGADEATKLLSKLILNKKVFIKVRFVDIYKRLVAEVYDEKGELIATKLAKEGAVIVRQKGEPNDQLMAAADQAMQKGIGLYGLPCTQDTNTEKPNCIIKGNIRLGGNEKLYHRPDCRNYKLTKVQLYLGDQWFCTESEAQTSGFQKGSDCK